MANESSGKKALKAGLGYTVGNMLVKGLSFLAIPLFARLMTVEDFGIYSTFSSYVMIMTVLAGFPLHSRWTSEEYLRFLRRNGWTVRKSAVLKASFPLTYAECVKSEV